MNNIHQQAAEALQQKTQALITRFLKGKEPDFLKQHTRLLDDYFRQAFEASMVGPRMDIGKNPYAIIALGGYGREEQCIHSDVDMLFLFKKKVPKEAENLIQEFIYPLWDIGLEVGYATRSLKECLALAGKDYEVLTPMLDARFVCGWSLIYGNLLERLREEIIKKKSRKIIGWLVENNELRHAHFGDSTYLLEPNLKEGQGGLRDYHTMLWIARIAFNARQSRDLEYLGLLSHEEFQTLNRSIAFIWGVRNRMHHVCKRKCDQLHFENQVKLAKSLKYKKINGQAPVERFMGELHGQMEALKQQHLMFLHDLGYEKKRKRKRKSQKISAVDGLEVIKWGMLGFSGPEAIVKNPELLMKIFEESARLKIPLSAEARRLVKEFSHLADKAFRTSEPVVKSFERILAAQAPKFNVLNEMLNTGFLKKFIPEFHSVHNRIQYDEYHLYPVDKHLLRTVQTVKKFGTAKDSSLEPLCEQIYRKLRRKKLLLWAALLHDIGKGESEEDHSTKGAEIVKTILTQKGMSSADIETVIFLVQEHLLLIKTATRRDIQDEETAIACARKIKDVERLKMLYLLTVADSIATGPMAWNDWTAALLRDFFLKTLNVLEKGELASAQAVEVVEQKKKEAIRSARSTRAKRKIENLLDVMSPRYLLYMPAHEIKKHIELYNDLSADNSQFIWEIEHDTDANTRSVTICAKDRPGLISKIAGVFTLNNIDILDVQVFTWRNNIALDIFKVTPPPDPILEDEKWIRTAGNLEAALTDKMDVAAALDKKVRLYRNGKTGLDKKPHQVTVDNASSSFFTIIEVFTYDFPGLLFSITDALYRCDLSIWVAKIATKADQVVDVFYVRDLNGQKVDLPDQVEKIKAAVMDRLPIT
ncbi:MAG: [protein-PII] uridylyltransferase [Deltaproteobacteria bacterium]|jgi:[protein-PII] uridylyltransferase|nr:[protein-PII] uridylyltransferase [Deltaproteobacteria bacterium]